MAAAGAAWDKAPMHIKAMAGAYVTPLMQAIQAMEEEKKASFESAATCAKKMLDFSADSEKQIRTLFEDLAAPFGVFRT